MAGLTGLEPATSDVTGRRSNRAELQPRCLFYIITQNLVGGRGFEPLTPGL